MELDKYLKNTGYDSRSLAHQISFISGVASVVAHSGGQNNPDILREIAVCTSKIMEISDQSSENVEDLVQSYNVSLKNWKEGGLWTN